jgi:hypothetical protein
VKLASLILRGLRNALHVAARHLAYEVPAQAKRLLAPRRDHRFVAGALLRATDAPAIAFSNMAVTAALAMVWFLPHQAKWFSDRVRYWTCLPGTAARFAR